MAVRELIAQPKVEHAEELVQRKDGDRSVRRGSAKDSIQAMLLAQLSGFDAGEAAGHLAQLQEASTQLYAEAMSALQSAIGNQAVSQLHVDVQRMAGGQGAGGSTGGDSQRSLPGDVQAKMEGAFEQDFSSVKVFEGPQASQIGALAYAQGEELHFAPGQLNPGTGPGQQLLGHELAHVVQQRAGRVGAPTGTANGVAINSDPSLEREADSAGARAASGQKAGVQGGASTAQAKMAPAQRSAEEIVLRLAGVEKRVTPEDGQTEFTKSINWEPVSGLQLVSAHIYLDSNNELERGTISGAFQVGDYVSSDSLRLSITSSGDVSASITGAQLRIGEIIAGTIDCEVSSGGITGEATIGSSQINIGNGLTVNSGELRASMDASGNISANGTLELGIAGIGTLRFEAQLRNTDFTGSLTLTLDQPLEVLGGVSVEEVNLTGNYGAEGFRLDGRVTVKVRDWAQAEITGSYSYPDNTWSANGTIRQINSLEVAGFTVENGELTVSMTENTLQEVGARCDFRFSQFRGDIRGSYSVPDNLFEGEGNAELESELAIGSTGVMLKSATGSAKVEANRLTELRGDANAEIPYEGQPTFSVSLENGFVDVTNSQVSGTGRTTLMRELALTVGSTTCTLQSGEVEAVVTNNNLESATIRDVAFVVTAPLGDQTVTLNGNLTEGTYADGKVTVRGDLTLANALTFGADGNSFTINSGTLEVDVRENNLERAGIRNVSLAAQATVAGSTLNLEGDITQGALVGDKIDFDGEIRVTDDFSVTAGPVTATLKGGGSIGVVVVQSSFESATLTAIRLEARATLGTSTLALAGDISTGTIDSDGKLTTDVSISVEEDLTVAFGQTGSATLKQGGTVKLKIADSEFQEAEIETLEAEANIPVGSSTLALTGSVDTGKVDSAGNIDFEGSISTSADCTVTAGIVEATLKQNATLRVKVEQSSFIEATFEGVELESDITTAAGVLKLTGRVAEGKVDGSGNVDFDATIDVREDCTFAFGQHSATLKQGGSLRVKVAGSSFEFAEVQNLEITGDFAVAGSVLKLEGGISQGRVDASGNVDIDASIGVREDFVVSIGQHTVTVKQGSRVKLNVAQSQFGYAEAESIEVLGDFVLGASTLKLSGQITTGKVDASGNVDLDGTISVREDCTFTFGQHTATLKQGGELQVKVEQSTFQFAEIRNIEVLGDFTAGGSVLKLQGNLSQGRVDGSGNVTLQGSIEVREDFIVTFGQHTATLKQGGRLSVSVTESTFDHATIEQLEILGDFAIAGSTLKLSGQITSGRVAGDGSVDLDGGVSVREDFTVNFGSGHNATLKQGGEVTASVAASTFQEARVNNLEVLVNLQLAGSTLALSGQITSGKVDGEGKVDIEGSIEVLSDFTVQMGSGGSTATLKGGGRVDAKVEGSSFQHAEFTGIQVLADIVVAGSTLKLEANLNEGRVDENGKVTVEATVSVREDFVVTFGQHTATLKQGGQVRARVAESSFEYAQVENLEVLADFAVMGSTLKLGGSLSQGKVDASGNVDIEGAIDVREDCTVSFGSGHTATLKQGGRMTAKVEQSNFIEATVQNLTVEADLSVAGSTLKLQGTITEGKVDGNGISVDATISVRDDFVFSFGSGHTGTLKGGGQVRGKIENSEFQFVEFQGVEVHADLSVLGSTLKLGATLNEGKVDKDGKVTLDATISVREDFTFSFGSGHSATLKQGGEVQGKITESNFEFVEIRNIEVLVDLSLLGSTLKLGGTISSGKVDADGNVDIDGSIEVKEDFTFSFGTGHSATLKQGGRVHGVVTGSEFQYAEVENLVVEADFAIAGSTLKLSGEVSQGKVDKDGKVDLDASIGVREDFTVAFGSGHTATLKQGGTLKAKVEQSSFIHAEVENVQVLADLQVAGSTLKLQGDITKGKVDGQGNVDIDASITVREDFTVEFGSGHTATLKANGRVKAVVEQSTFIEAAIENLEVLADLAIAGSTLKLQGTLTTGKVDGQGNVDIDATIRVREDFVVNFDGGHVVTLKEGGELQAKVEQSVFQFAEIRNITVLGDFQIAGSTLKLEGAISSGRVDSNGKIDLDASITVREDFTVTFGASHSATLKQGGRLKANVQQSVFQYAEVENIQVLADIVVAGSTLKLQGDITKGKVAGDGKVDLEGTITVREDCSFTFGSGHSATLKQGGSLEVKVEQSNFIHAMLRGIQVLVDLSVLGSTLKLDGQIPEGKIDGEGKVDIEASVSVREDFTFSFGTGHSATLKQGGTVKGKIEQSAFQWAEIEAVTVEANLAVLGSTLKLRGDITKGKVDNAGMVDLEGSVEVTDNFTFSFGSGHQATLESGGRVTAKVAQSQFQEATIENLSVSAHLQVLGSELSVRGTIESGKIDNQGNVDLEGSVTILSDFRVTFGDHVATLKRDGVVRAKVEASQFQWAEVENLEVIAELKVMESTLKLSGRVDSGKVDNAGNVDLEGSITVMEDFVVSFGDHTATLKANGVVRGKVAQSVFQWAKIEQVTVLADISVAGSTLNLRGDITSGQVDGQGKIDLDASISVVNDFTVTFGEHSATLKAGGTVKAKVEQSSFIHAEIENLVVEAAISILGSTLNLRGEITKGKVDNQGKIDVEGSISVVNDFTATFGQHTATLKAGGTVKAKVEQSVFQWAEIENVEVLADVVVAGSTLKLRGAITDGKVHSDGKVDLEGEIGVREDFTLTFGQHSATLKAGGTLKVKIEQSEFQWAEITSVEVLADLVVGGNTLKLSGRIDNGKVHSDGKVDVNAAISVREDFNYTMAPVSATLKAGGTLTVKVEQSAFKEAQLTDIEVLADVTVQNGVLKLSGRVNNGKIDENNKFDLDCQISVREDFVYTLSPVTATLKANSGLRVVIEQNEFKYAELINVQVLADITIEGQTLSLRGDIHTGRYENGKIDFDASLTLVSDFTYTLSVVTVKFMANSSLRVKVEQSEFKWAELNGLVVQADITLGSSVLKLQGTVETGRYENGKVDFVGAISVREDFVYTMAPVTATLKAGSTLRVCVEQSEYKYAELVNVQILADIVIGDQTLSLRGDITQGRHEDGKIDFRGSLTLVSDFNYTLGTVRITFKGGASLEVCVEQSEFAWAELSGLEVEARFTLGTSEMALGGALTSGRYEDGKVDALGTISLLSDFNYQFGGTVDVTLVEGGSLTVCVEQSEFKYAEIANVTVRADITIDGQVLSLEGSITQGRYEDGKISITGSLRLLSDFRYTLGNVTAIFKEGASLTVCVEESEFKWAELAGLVVQVDITLGDQVLSLQGALTRGRYEAGKIDVLGTISVLTDFTKQFGNVAATLKAGGSLTVCVEQSEFKYAELAAIRVEANIAVGDDTLRLGGEITQGRYADGKIDLEGTIELMSDFEYSLGSLTAKLFSGGSLTVKIEQNEFQWARISNVRAEVAFQVGDKNIRLGGSITEGTYHANGKIDLDASIDLLAPVVLFEAGKFTATLTSASVSFLVTQSELTRLEANGRADIAVDAGAGNNISGWLQINWRNEGGVNTFSGAGELNVTMLEGKLHGTIAAQLFEDGRWNIQGDLEYEMNEIIKGRIGVQMDQDLDPVLSGDISITGMELYPGRDLINQTMQIVPPVSINIYGVNLGIGCDAGLRVALRPILFNASIGITGFRPLHMNMPTFNANAEVTGGLDLEAFIEPYLFLSLGVPPVDAGIKVEGKVSLVVPVVLSAGLRLFADGTKFGGEFNVGASIRPVIRLAFTPKVYARAGSAEAEYAFLGSYNYEFPELFTFEWNKSFKFGDEGPQTDAGPGATPQEETGSQTQVAEAAAERTQSSDTGGGSEPSVSRNQPQIGQEQGADGGGGGEASEMQQKMAEIQEWAEHVGNVAKLIGFAIDVGVISATLSFLGPAAPFVAVVIAMLKNDMSLGDIGAGFTSLVWIIGKAVDWIASMLPDWFMDAWQELQRIISLGAAGAAMAVKDKIKEALSGILPSPWDGVMEPLFDWVANQAEALILAFEGFNPINPIDWLILILKLMWGAISGVRALVDAFSEAISRLVLAVRELIYDGSIVCTCTDVDDWAKNPWIVKANLPGIINYYRSGDDTITWGIAQFAPGIMKNTFGANPNTNTSHADYGFDYR